MEKRGSWHSRKHYVGLHYDLHAQKDDTALGTKADPKLLVPMLKIMKPDWVQTDCKGHPGYTSWFSKIPEASVPPGLTADAMAKWRKATSELGLPLHCHYSGLWDSAAGKRHPKWAVQTAEGKAAGAPMGGSPERATNDVMCPRGPYIDKLMIPQMIELIDRYGVDGFWVDGEIWAAKPCYCPRCMKVWKKETGLTVAPVSAEEEGWADWMLFTRRSFEAYVTKYCNAIHTHNPNVKICSNWLQTFKDPGEPAVPTDWISGDNIWVYGLDQSRCESRFLSTRGKPWDIMLWAFYTPHGLGNEKSPMTFKPIEMLMQEAAVIAAFGGNVQIYEHPPVRDGRLISWRQKRLSQVVKFIKKRRSLCQGAETIPQVAVLHSEHHLQQTLTGPNLQWNVDTSAVEGATYALLENHFGVDILDEWALTPRIAEFPVVVVPEQHAMSEGMVATLLNYASAGGKLFVSGSAMFSRLGADAIGAQSIGIESNRAFSLASKDGDVPVYSEQWRILKATGANVVGTLGDGSFLDGQDTGHPAAVLTKFGKGKILYVPGSIFTDFHRNRYPMCRVLVGALMGKLIGKLAFEVDAPISVDVAFRKIGKKTVIHLINRSSGIPNQPNNGAVDAIPAVGPISIQMNIPIKPCKLTAAYEGCQIKWKHAKGVLSIVLPSIRIHEAVVIE